MFTQILTTALSALPALAQQDMPKNPQMDEAVQALLTLAQQAPQQQNADGARVIKLDGPEAQQAMQRIVASAMDKPQQQAPEKWSVSVCTAPEQNAVPQPMRRIEPSRMAQHGPRIGGPHNPQGRMNAERGKRPERSGMRHISHQGRAMQPMAEGRNFHRHHRMGADRQQCRKAAWLCGARPGMMNPGMRHISHQGRAMQPMAEGRNFHRHHRMGADRQQCRKAAWLCAARPGMMNSGMRQHGQRPERGMRHRSHQGRSMSGAPSCQLQWYAQAAKAMPMQPACMASKPFCTMPKTFCPAPAAQQAPTINVFIININAGSQQGGAPKCGTMPACFSGNSAAPEAAVLQQILPALMQIGNCR